MHPKLFTVTIFATPLVTGCSSEITLEKQTKLVEYQGCLSAESEQWNMALSKGQIQTELKPGGKFWIESENRPYQVFEFAQSMCEQYKP